jgi:predicted Kef-type K+ transport protein
MNSRGQMTVGMIIVLAVTLIVGLVLFQVIAQNVGETTNTVALENQTLADLTNGTLVYVTNCRALSDVAIFNATGDVEIPSDEYTVTNNVVYNGALAVSILPDVDITKGYDVGVTTIDATCQPLTYAAESGSRAMLNLIVIFFALAIAAVALYPVYGSKLMEMFGK